MWGTNISNPNAQTKNVPKPPPQRNFSQQSLQGQQAQNDDNKGI